MGMKTKAAITVTMNAYRQISSETRPVIAQVLTQSAEAIRDDAAERILQGPKTGRLYRRGGGDAVHQASAPGEAPADESGELANNIIAALDEVETRLRADIIANSVHGIYMELGDPSRPFLTPASEAETPRFQKGVADAVGEGVRRAVRRARPRSSSRRGGSSP